MFDDTYIFKFILRKLQQNLGMCFLVSVPEIVRSFCNIFKQRHILYISACIELYRFSASWWSGNKKYYFYLQQISLYFKAMPVSLDFYQEISLHIIPVHSSTQGIQTAQQLLSLHAGNLPMDISTNLNVNNSLKNSCTKALACSVA